QAPVSGLAVDLLSPHSPESKVLNIRSALVRGTLPGGHGEILMAEELAQRLHVQPGQTATLVSATMDGSMAIVNFAVAGTVRFGIGALDRTAVIADLTDIQQAPNMEGGAGEILGFSRDDLYHEERAEANAADFNARHANDAGKFAPVMGTLRSQSGLADVLDYVAAMSRIIVAVFAFVMSVVLWNAGLTGSLRRYGEFGLRLAVGEENGHIYRSMLLEALAIGIVGASLGTALGLAGAWYLEVHGLDIGAMLKNNAMMITDVVRADIEPVTCVIGFLPGIAATLVGSAMAGIGIYRRQTSQLFKELET
ncbi:MAG TPA: FtsX-like permease family protein, partial [Bacteroidota bacterium]